jgi:hypothetical protein
LSRAFFLLLWVCILNVAHSNYVKRHVLKQKQSICCASHQPTREHADDADDPLDVVVDPSGQLMQAMAPTPGMYVPCGHGEHRASPGDAA